MLSPTAMHFFLTWHVGIWTFRSEHVAHITGLDLSRPPNDSHNLQRSNPEVPHANLHKSGSKIKERALLKNPTSLLWPCIVHQKWVLRQNHFSTLQKKPSNQSSLYKNKNLSQTATTKSTPCTVAKSNADPSHQMSTLHIFSTALSSLPIDGLSLNLRIKRGLLGRKLWEHSLKLCPVEMLHGHMPEECPLQSSPFLGVWYSGFIFTWDDIWGLLKIPFYWDIMRLLLLSRILNLSPCTSSLGCAGTVAVPKTMWGYNA